MNDKKHDDFFDETPEGADPEKTLLTMLETYDKPVLASVEVGSKVTGKILSVNKPYAFVDIGAKNEAMISFLEVSDAEGVPTKNPGDTIEAYVVSAKNSEIMLSTVLSKKEGGARAQISELIDAMKNEMPIEGKVTGINKGGFNIRILGQRAFCPISQIELKRVEDPNPYLNATLSFVVTQVSEGGRNIVVSRLPLLEDGLVATLDSLQQGAVEKKVYTGAITRITPFGLFVDLGDLEGLVHISEAAWERTNDLNESYSVGQKISCVVLGVEKKEPLRNSKISLSIKQVTDNPWATVSEKFKAGDVVDGKITRLAHFGAFVQLIPGVEGLIHISEMSWGKKVRHPSDVVAEGQMVKVTILGVDENKKEISCSLKDMDADPWKDVGEKFPVGAVVTGTVAQASKFGYFIDLTDSITGLLPFGNIAADKKDGIVVGAPLEVAVEGLDVERRRISLSLGKVEDRRNAGEVKEYLKTQQQAQAASSSSDSVFGDALRKAMEKK
jgi:small subunit ribosomal protein S1